MTLSNTSLRTTFPLAPNVHDPYFLNYSPLNFFDIYSKNLKNRQNTMSKMSKVWIATKIVDYDTPDT